MYQFPKYTEKFCQEVAKFEECMAAFKQGGDLSNQKKQGHIGCYLHTHKGVAAEYGMHFTFYKCQCSTTEPNIAGVCAKIVGRLRNHGEGLLVCDGVISNNKFGVSLRGPWGQLSRDSFVSFDPKSADLKVRLVRQNRITKMELVQSPCLDDGDSGHSEPDLKADKKKAAQ